MKSFYLLTLATSLALSTVAQEKFEQGRPNNTNYRYLNDYQALKNYVDRSKYPQFKLGAGTTVNEYLNNTLVNHLINRNFDETVAGNAMKMASCVDGNGHMNFSTVKQYVSAATEAGLNVYGHTLAWHSQQANGWLRKLLADKPAAGEETWQTVASKDFRQSQNVGWKASESDYGYSIKFNATNGLVVKTTKEYPWQVQFQAMTDILLTKGKRYKLCFAVKGSKPGRLDGRLGDWSVDGPSFSIPFSKEWQNVEVEITPELESSFMLLHVVNYVGEVSIKSIRFEGYAGKTVPQTAQERHDTLVYAMDKWIKGMMEACDGQVKAWDLVNEAIAGDGNDGQGNYELQHSSGYKSGTWDVGGDAFYWQDYLGDLDYVRQACRIARKYGPKDVKLFINDYNLESDWDDNKKVKSLVNWIKKWEADGVTHIDGIGTQMHISCFENENILNSIKQHITTMFEVIAASGKLCRVSEMDMGYVRGSDRWGKSVKTSELTEDEHKRMANFYEWIIKEYLRVIPAAQQWGICQWCPTDAPANSGWRGGEPVGIWDLDYYRKHVFAGFVRGLGGVASGISPVAASEEAAGSKGIYTLSGACVPATSATRLHAGVYIINGKKQVVK